MRARSIPAACALLLALGGGCKSEIVDKLKEMAGRACACPDVDCAGRVEKEYYDFYSSNKHVNGTQSEADELKEHFNRMRECIAKVRAAHAGQGAAPASAPAAAPPESASPAPGKASSGKSSSGRASAGKASAGKTDRTQKAEKK